MISLEAALQQLYIVRAQVDLAIAIVGGVVDGPPAAAPPEGPGGCLHPEDHRHDATTGGDGPPKWICDICDQTFDGPLP